MNFLKDETAQLSLYIYTIYEANNTYITFVTT